MISPTLRKRCATFDQALFNWDDQATIRSLVLSLVPDDVKAEILRRYNEHVVRVNTVTIQHFMESRD